MMRFQRAFRITEKTRILDVGGSAGIWRYASVQPNLTIVNLPSALQPLERRKVQVAADGCMLPFGDNEFDIVFSNSVIEHVGSVENQRKFAQEIARVGKCFWVQTPNKGFPVEQHLLLPLVHLLTPKWQASIVNRFTGWEFVVRPSKAERHSYIHHCLHELKLLNASDLQKLFPDAQVVSERFFTLKKSLIAIRS